MHQQSCCCVPWTLESNTCSTDSDSHTATATATATAAATATATATTTTATATATTNTIQCSVLPRVVASTLLPFSLLSQQECLPLQSLLYHTGRRRSKCGSSLSTLSKSEHSKKIFYCRIFRQILVSILSLASTSSTTTSSTTTITGSQFFSVLMLLLLLLLRRVSSTSSSTSSSSLLIPVWVIGCHGI